jgi:pyruvate dehydrogenase (quinone)
MPRKLEIAIREAVANRGVSVVVLPGDVALQPAFDAPLLEVSSPLPSQPVVMPASEVLDWVSSTLERPA